MGYVLRVRLSSFFAGAATASLWACTTSTRTTRLPMKPYLTRTDEFLDWGLVDLSCDLGLLGGIENGDGLVEWALVVVHDFDLVYLVKNLYESLNNRVSALEKLEEPEPPQPVQAPE
ncbi:hypothetical protein Sjap_005688 [Stephania japonica]|uniref:Uncharacterized protein n=1 Tax=Stephania japonica TaxID=461633 RepID=A0AAP0K722_9MAGN